MSIWTYSQADRDEGRVRAEVPRRDCVYCFTPLETVRADTTSAQHPYATARTLTKGREVRCCPVCGWWYVCEDYETWDDTGLLKARFSRCGASGVLRNLDVASQSVALEEIRSYLAARYDARYDIDPRVFENVVTGVYQDLGGQVQATGRTGDGGIDAVIQTLSGETIGIQVKRYRGKIGAAQIREFAGALYLKGMLSGIYVTTSTFTTGAQLTARQAAAARIPIELVDARSFYAQLGLAQRARYSSSDHAAPFANVRLVTIQLPWSF